MKWLLTTQGQRTILDLPSSFIEGQATTVEIDGCAYIARWQRYSGTLYLSKVGDSCEQVYQMRDLVIEPQEDRAARVLRLQYRGPSGAIENLTAALEPFVPGLENRGNKNQEQGATVRSPMAGTLLRVDVQEGDRVEKGQTLCIIEAMKMENQMKAPVSGIVRQISLAAGQSVTPRQKLMVIKDA